MEEALDPVADKLEDVDEAEDDEEEEEVDSLAKEIFANVVRPQFGSTSNAKLLI